MSALRGMCRSCDKPRMHPHPTLTDQGEWKGGVRPGQSLGGYRIEGAHGEEAARWRARDERIQRERTEFIEDQWT